MNTRALFFLISVFAIVPFLAYAQGSPNPEGVNTVLENILKTLEVVVQILLTASFVVFGWGILKLITAGGNTTTVKQAKGVIWWGVLALFVLASLYGIILFIKTSIGIPENEPITVPKFSGN